MRQNGLFLKLGKKILWKIFSPGQMGVKNRPKQKSTISLKMVPKSS